MKNSKDESTKNEQVVWEVWPGGILVQKRDDDNQGQDNHEGAGSRGPMVKINITHGSRTQYEVHVPAQSTFGDLKKVIAEKTGLESQEQRLFFRGKEKGDSEHLRVSGVKDKSKVLLWEQLTNKEKQPEEVKDSEETIKAPQAVAGVRAQVDKLSERVAALEVVVNGGDKVSAVEFDASAELLMKELLKLDSIEADGEAKIQRKAEVRRVQKFHETLDSLKARNSRL